MGEIDDDERPSGAPPSEEPTSTPRIPMGKTPEPRAPALTKNRLRSTLIVSAPIVSVATLMLGLRVGAGSAVHAAALFVAPPGSPTAKEGPTPFAWQVLTYLEDRGVRETKSMEALSVRVSSSGREARWTGRSNEDGIAEVNFELPSTTGDSAVEIEISRAGEASPLAMGRIDPSLLAPRPTAPSEREGELRTPAAVRPSRREGTIGVDVVVEGERLVVGFETSLWVHVVSAPNPHTLDLAIEPEAGLAISTPRGFECDGYAEVSATAQAHVVGAEVKVTDREDRSRHGVWFGALPVAPGAFFVGAPRFVPAGKAETAVLVAPNPRQVVYAEVDDERGRVFAAALPLSVDPDSPIPRARFEMPPLASGLHWIVVSGEPRGAERLAGATIAKPFLVGDPERPDPRAPNVRPSEACSIGPWLAQHPATGFPRSLALDGMATRGASNRARHRAGLAIGLASLLIAAVLEVLLLTAASREARAVMLLAEIEEPEEERRAIVAKPPGGGLAIALLVAMLGFALLGALMIAKG